MKTLTIAFAAAVARRRARLTGRARRRRTRAARSRSRVYADTVSSSRGDVKLASVCTQTNSFPRKARVVFRTWAVDTETGKAIGADEIRYAYVKIPGQPNLS